MRRYDVPGPRGRRGTGLPLRAWLAAAALGAAGCCGEAYEAATTYPVTGTVRLADGKPLASGRVVLVSDATALSYAGAVEDGGFAVKNGPREGAPEGRYKVRIEVDETRLKAAKGRPPRLPFAARYADEDASGLTAAVRPGDNTLEFRLAR